MTTSFQFAITSALVITGIIDKSSPVTVSGSTCARRWACHGERSFAVRRSVRRRWSRTRCSCLERPRQPRRLLVEARRVALQVPLPLDLEPGPRRCHHLILTAALTDTFRAAIAPFDTTGTPARHRPFIPPQNAKARVHDRRQPDAGRRSRWVRHPMPPGQATPGSYASARPTSTSSRRMTTSRGTPHVAPWSSAACNAGVNAITASKPSFS